MAWIERAKQVAGLLLILIGFTGVAVPDGTLAGLNDAITAVGAFVLLFTEHALPLPEDD